MNHLIMWFKAHLWYLIHIKCRKKDNKLLIDFFKYSLNTLTETSDVKDVSV